MNKITGLKQIADFVLAGRAKFTIVDTKTKERCRYRVNTPKNATSPVWFGSVYDNSKYKYSIMKGGPRNFPAGFTAKSLVGFNDLRAKYLMALFRKIETNVELPSHIEVWHEGYCGKCGRKLTRPESMKIGLGPECSGLGHKQYSLKEIEAV